MKINNESDFQKWFADILLPAISEGTVVISDGNNRNGVSDITWIVPGCGVFAIELKYAKIKESGVHGRFLSGHKLAALQAIYLERWADATDEAHAIVAVGTDTGEVIFYNGKVVYEKVINDISVHERFQYSSYHASSIVGKGRASLQKSVLMQDLLENIRENMFMGSFNVEK